MAGRAGNRRRDQVIYYQYGADRAGHDFYRRGSRLVEADCPSGPDADYYAGTYDVAAFDEMLCADQPRAAFVKWWEWNRQLRIVFILSFDYDRVTVDGRQVGPPFPTSAGGRSATMTVTTELTAVARSDAPESHQHGSSSPRRPGLSNWRRWPSAAGRCVESM
jgi:hypothetical protein